MKRPGEIYIVGGGPSLRGQSFDSLRDKMTIVVNASILDVPNPNYFITIDYSFLSKIPNIKTTLRESPATKVFVANMQHDYMKEVKGAIVDTRFNLAYDLSPFDLIVKTQWVDGIGYTFREFRTGLNSGFCALQLAVLLRAEKIFLLGVDLGISGHTHYHDRYLTRVKPFVNILHTYHQYWVSGLRQLQAETDVQVFSCSPICPLNKKVIPYIPYEEVLK
jgi:hypothetical protein